MEERYFGKDCPEGLVQVETVMTDAEPRAEKRWNGWKPGRRATVEIYVSGRRYIVLAGDAAKDYGHTEAGIVVMNECGLQARNVAINSVLVTYDAAGEAIWQKHSKR
jgi:hypothetical protein